MLKGYIHVTVLITVIQKFTEKIPVLFSLCLPGYTSSVQPLFYSTKKCGTQVIKASEFPNNNNMIPHLMVGCSLMKQKSN